MKYSVELQYIDDVQLNNTIMMLQLRTNVYLKKLFGLK